MHHFERQPEGQLMLKRILFMMLFMVEVLSYTLRGDREFPEVLTELYFTAKMFSIVLRYSHYGPKVRIPLETGLRV
jgi:hypothetical protein